MKYLRYIILGILFTVVVSTTFGSITFATKRLQQMSISLKDIPFDSLGQGVHLNYSYENHPLVIRVNEWQEVEHIGYYIFDTIMERQSPSLVYDFLERYLLDLDLCVDPDKMLRMGIDKFVVEVGKITDIFNIKITDVLDISYSNFTRYRLSWTRDGVCILSFMFDMDNQFLMGCNSIEQENLYFRNITRYPRREHLPPTLPNTDDSISYYYIEKGGDYLIPSICNELYYQRDTMGCLNLICDGAHPEWSSYNILLSADSLGDFDFEITLDLYGYRDTVFTMPVCDWMEYCKQEGCKAFFGIKSKTPRTIRGTIFCPNEAGGYCHMMSVELSREAIEKRQGIIRGRLYVYIPLHNITPDYFTLKYMN